MTKPRYISLFVLSLLTLSFASCSPQSSNAEPTVDVVGTTAAQLASMMLTQTAAAYTPPPPPAAETPIPLFTDTPTLEPTTAATTIPRISSDTPCYAGPGSSFGLVSNISATEEVEVVGISSTPGWYVIRNPIYGSLCWVPSSTLDFAADFDLSTLPTIP